MGEAVEHPDRLVDAARTGHARAGQTRTRLAQAVGEPARQADQRALEQGEVDLGAVVEAQRGGGRGGCVGVGMGVGVGVAGRRIGMVQPLPQLGAGDLGSSGVLHQPVDRHAAVAVEPCGEVAHADLDVALEPGAADRARRRLDQLVARHHHVLAPHVLLVRGRHALVEDRPGQRDQRRVRDPGAIEAGGHLAQLVGADLGHRGVVGGDAGRITAADRDLRRHAAHRVRAAPVAGLDQQLGVGAQERLGHHHLRALGQHPACDGAAPVGTERLEVAEDVVPASAVEPGDAAAQRVQDLVHLEGRRQRLDQHGDLDLPRRQAQRLLDMVEHVVPQRRLLHRLQLGQVKIGSAFLRGEHVRVVEREQAEVEQAGRHRHAIDPQVFLVEVPAARANHQHRLLRERLERVVPARAAGARIRRAPVRRPPVERAGDRLPQRALAGQQVVPGWRGAVLEVGHEAVRAGVEGVDHHLRVGRTGDLDAAVEQRGRQRRDAPVAGADRGGVGAEVRQAAGVEIRLTFAPRR